jgi:hypothetical protein
MGYLSRCARRVSASMRRTAVIAVLGFSAISTLIGMWALIAFEQTPGAVSAAPGRWPVSSAVKRVSGRPEIVVFVHPFCSCTDATIAELAHLSVREKPGAAAPVITVLFYRPRSSAWAPNGLWNKARDLEFAQVAWDDDGVEARRFGARTSGYVLLYNSSGSLLFRGGVTGSRGHRGDNYGLDELVASLDSQRPAPALSRVFGCALGGWNEETDGKL